MLGHPYNVWLGKVRLREKACPGPPPTTISISYAEKLSLLSISISFFSWNEAHGKNAQTSPEKTSPQKTPGLVKIFDNFEKNYSAPRFSIISHQAIMLTPLGWSPLASTNDKCSRILPTPRVETVIKIHT